MSGRTFETINPATGQPLGQVAFGDADDVERAVAAAWRAYCEGRWTDLAPSERGRRMRRVASFLLDHVDELATLEARDSGAPITKTRGDVHSASALFEYFSQLPEHVSGRTYATDPGYFVYSRREPYGVVGAIAPWNFPLLLACWKTAPAIAVGNSVVLKMAEQAPLTTSLFAQFCLEAGIPAGVVNVVHGDGPTTGAALVRHPAVPKITFTGSTDVGREILRNAADHKSVHLELGGKTPNIVFDDADIEQALAGSVFTSFFNSGQVCTSGSRLLVADGIADDYDFTGAFVERIDSLVVGDPLDERTHLGPLVSDEQHRRVVDYIASGQQQGATMLVGSGSSDVSGLDDGYFVRPTLFTDVNTRMRIAQEEIFGPVTALVRFSDVHEAVRIANDVAYGLAASVWTNDRGRALRMANRLEAGVIWTNCPNRGQWNVPYEGHKASGLGEDKGLECIVTFTQLKVHHVNFGGHRQQWV